MHRRGGGKDGYARWLGASAKFSEPDQNGEGFERFKACVGDGTKVLRVFLARIMQASPAC